MRPKQSIATRLARHTGQPVEAIEKTLAEIQPGSGRGECWVWQGAYINVTPVMKHCGRVVPVRRVIHEAAGINVRVQSGCPNKLCVNPSHSRPANYNRILGATEDNIVWLPSAPPMVDPTAKGQWIEVDGTPFFMEERPDSVEDVMDCLFSFEEPFDAKAIAEETRYDLLLVEEAIARFRAGEI
jgi:hypothetical protein